MTDRDTNALRNELAIAVNQARVAADYRTHPDDAAAHCVRAEASAIVTSEVLGGVVQSQSTRPAVLCHCPGPPRGMARKVTLYVDTGELVPDVVDWPGPATVTGTAIQAQLADAVRKLTPVVRAAYLAVAGRGNLLAARVCARHGWTAP